MRLVIQRVLEGNVSVNQTVIGSIKKGYVVFVGICDEDTTQTADKMVHKLINLRICDDSEGKTNLSIKDTEGSILLVSQFTLYANCKKGNRPSFADAGSPVHAETLYKYMMERIEHENIPISHGEFGADMKVSLINDGPFTIVLDSALL